VSRFAIFLAALPILPMAGCFGPTRAAQSAVADAQPTLSVPIRAWEVVEASKVIGIVVEFEELGGERQFYSVRNPAHQELGIVDVHGRAWRYRAHNPEPDWLATGTVLEGVRSILGAGFEIQTFEVPVSTLLDEAN
jgi:hypothetical protein